MLLPPSFRNCAMFVYECQNSLKHLLGVGVAWHFGKTLLVIRLQLLKFISEMSFGWVFCPPLRIAAHRFKEFHLLLARFCSRRRARRQRAPCCTGFRRCWRRLLNSNACRHAQGWGCLGDVREGQPPRQILVLSIRNCHLLWHVALFATVKHVLLSWL